MFQVAGGRKNDRKDHIWAASRLSLWKCLLCGAVAQEPPDYPTPEAWMPLRYEPLTPAERLESAEYDLPQ